MSIGNEELLDQLYELTNKRAADIRATGIDFQISGSSKEFRGVLNEEGNLVHAEPGLKLYPFQLLVSRRGDYIAISAKAQAGRTAIEVVRSSGRLNTFDVKEVGTGNIAQKTTFQLRQKSSSVPYFMKDGQIFTIPGSITTGDVVQLLGTKYQVVSKSVAASSLERLSLVKFEA